ncbi:hypothetical protein OSB04_027657 [Centaurea solstitialis]|uniref:Uncharacterized protein n=1 Tax=Centaurea solstitialis TaxID=347529 RepID=A0AA38SR85_9ASTR|nr:hypothetical protein OSB04_027657 [Centaurea solstitialis]
MLSFLDLLEVLNHGKMIALIQNEPINERSSNCEKENKYHGLTQASGSVWSLLRALSNFASTSQMRNCNNTLTRNLVESLLYSMKLVAFDHVTYFRIAYVEGDFYGAKATMNVAHLIQDLNSIVAGWQVSIYMGIATSDSSHTRLVRLVRWNHWESEGIGIQFPGIPMFGWLLRMELESAGGNEIPQIRDFRILQHMEGFQIP